MKLEDFLFETFISEGKQENSYYSMKRLKKRFVLAGKQDYRKKYLILAMLRTPSIIEDTK